MTLRKDTTQTLTQTNRLNTSTKDKERDITYRKSLIDIPSFVIAVLYWQRERPALSESDSDINMLIPLIIREIEEVDEEIQSIGTSEYRFVSEKGEIIDVGFLMAIFTGLLHLRGNDVDFQDVLFSANGQSSGSNGLDKMTEAVGNISERTMEKDLKHIWILWVSYLIHMDHPVDPNLTLDEYTIPKNNGNYIKELLGRNMLFENAFGRPMIKEEQIAYFSHYRKATAIIRDFIREFVDPSIEDTGLRPEHYRPYEIFIYNFMYFRGTGMSPEKALSMLRDQLYLDYDVPHTVDKILVASV